MPEPKWPISDGQTIERESSIEQELIAVTKKIKLSGVFEGEYLAGTKLVLFPEEERGGHLLVFEHGRLNRKDAGEYSVSRFMDGSDTSFVGLNTRDDYESFDLPNLNDRQSVPLLFYQEMHFPYDEFVVHEAAHNVFDLSYKQTHGEFKRYDLVGADGSKNGEETDCSAEYIDGMKAKLAAVLEKYKINVPIEGFELKRQKIAEIFALLVQREYSKRVGQFDKVHGAVDVGAVWAVLSDLAGAIGKLNDQHGKDVKESDFFEENHIPSVILADALELEFPAFTERMEFFGIGSDFLGKDTVNQSD